MESIGRVLVTSYPLAAREPTSTSGYKCIAESQRSTREIRTFLVSPQLQKVRVQPQGQGECTAASDDEMR